MTSSLAQDGGAGRGYERFEGRASLRSWLYRIATNVCVDMGRSPQRRARPMALGAASSFAGARLDEQLGEERWIMAVLDAEVVALDGDPAEVTAARETVRLAFWRHGSSAPGTGAGGASSARSRSAAPRGSGAPA